MDKIPIETFLIILSHVDGYTRNYCIRVSKQWYSVIKNFYLYEAIELYSTNYRRAITFFEHNKEQLGRNVKLLRVRNGNLTAKDVMKWPTVFPLVQHLNIACFNLQFDDPNEEADFFSTENMVLGRIKPEIFEDWSKHMISIVEECRSIYTSTMLELATFHALKSVTINFFNEEGEQDFNDLIRNLNNAPNLSHLCAMNAMITLEQLDRLHRAVPKLEKLELKEVPIIKLDERRYAATDFTTEPANSIKVLDIGSSNSDSFFVSIGTDVFLEYISQKYINSESIRITLMGESATGAFPLEQRHLSSYIKKFTNLECFEIYGCYPLTEEMIISFDHAGVRLGSYICKEEIDIDTLRLLTESKQRNHIREVMIESANIRHIQALCCFSNLTDLSLESDFSADASLTQIPLNALLRLHPSLVRLRLTDFSLFVQANESDDSFQSSLQRLTLRGSTVLLEDDEYDEDIHESEDIFQFISRACPLLNVFIFEGRYDTYNPNWAVLSFPNQAFNVLSVEISGYYYLRQHNLERGTVRWYKQEAIPIDEACSIISNEKPIFEVTTDIPPEIIEGEKEQQNPIYSGVISMTFRNILPSGCRQV